MQYNSLEDSILYGENHILHSNSRHIAHDQVTRAWYEIQSIYTGQILQEAESILCDSSFE